MKILTLPRGAGKTHTLVQLMAENSNLVYVAVNYYQVEAAYKAARVLNPNIARERFQVADKVREYVQGRKIDSKSPELLIDELDSVLSVLLGGAGGVSIFLATRSS